MCKSSAEGGQRCQGHLRSGVTAAMTTYVVDATGLDRASAVTVIEDLRAEFADAPAPDRAEVDEFLERQAFRIRHEQALSEKRRNSLLGRIRAGIGRLLPDGPTFAAWKHSLAAAWQRAREPLKVAGAVAGVFIASVGLGTAMGAAGHANAANDAHFDANVETAISQKYGDAITEPGVVTVSTRYTEWGVNGQTVDCRTEYDTAPDDANVITDIDLSCLDGADNEFSPTVIGEVNPAAQIQSSTH